MEPNPHSKPASFAPFNPLSGWEAASRWNAATWDWMAQGFRQWMALMTTAPTPPLIPSPQARTTDLLDRPVASAEPKRPVRVKAKTKPRARPKARTRG
jgi:hypothetical protein